LLGTDEQIPKLIGTLLLNGYLSRDMSFLSFAYGTHNFLYQANSVNQPASPATGLIDKESRARARTKEKSKREEPRTKERAKNQKAEPRSKEQRLHFAASSSSDVPSV
jgi:hypothetical protein